MERRRNDQEQRRKMRIQDEERRRKDVDAELAQHREQEAHCDVMEAQRRKAVRRIRRADELVLRAKIYARDKEREGEIKEISRTKKGRFCDIITLDANVVEFVDLTIVKREEEEGKSNN